MRTLLLHADDLLRARGVLSPERAQERPWWLLPALVVAFVPVYGALMGSFALEAPVRLWQVMYAAVKIPLLLLATSAVCLPGFFVLNTLLGLRDDLKRAWQAILAGQAGLSIVLASLAPFTRFIYFCGASYRAALLFNLAMFAVATFAGQYVMFREYRVLIRRNPRHLLMLAAWLVLYGFVGIQMAWMLRPFVGDPHMPVAFFRPEPFSNAYEVVVRLIVGR